MSDESFLWPVTTRQANVEADAWVAQAEAGECGGEYDATDVVGGGEAQQPRGFLLALREVKERTAQRHDVGPDSLEQRRTGGRQRDLVGGPVEQRHPEQRLESGDHPARRPFADPEFDGRLREARRLGHSHEHPEVLEVDRCFHFAIPCLIFDRCCTWGTM